MNVDVLELLNHYYSATNDVYIYILIACVIFDIGTGYLKSWVNHTLNSSVGLKGLIKHFSVVIMIIIAYPFLLFLSFKGIAYALIVFPILNYLISIIENLDNLGVPIPKTIKKRLEKIRKQIDEEV